MKPMIQMLDGRAFDFTKPDVPTIETIAGALAKLCRFVGHASEFYSVAQHSVYVSHLVPERFAFAALLHDASEALTGDCSSPFKQMLPDFRRFEHEYQARIWARYVPGFNYNPAAKAAVRDADLQMLAAERRDLMPKQDPDGVWDWVEEQITPAPIQVIPVDWRAAEQMFLHRYKELAA